MGDAEIGDPEMPFIRRKKQVVRRKPLTPEERLADNAKKDASRIPNKNRTKRIYTDDTFGMT